MGGERLVKRVFRRVGREDSEGPRDLRIEAERGQILIEESRELLVVLDEQDRVLAASRRARERLDGLVEGAPIPTGLAEASAGAIRIPYTVDGRKETLVYLGQSRDAAAYEELRTGFTAAVSHELRTPLARLMALLESVELAGSDPAALVDQARSEVDRIRELIDDVLFLSELEGGREVVSLGAVRALPVLEGVLESLADRADRAGVTLKLECSASAELPLRQRMLEVVAKNLAENAIRYAGPGSTFTLSVERRDEVMTLAGRDDGRGVAETDLPRLFERFFRADPARASEGSGLGLAIVKHIANAAGGTVEAAAAPEGGLEITATFTTS
jgi:signal transduction histidine kinase